jgi:hypothetical protein
MIHCFFGNPTEFVFDLVMCLLKPEKQKNLDYSPILTFLAPYLSCNKFGKKTLSLLYTKLEIGTLGFL